MSHPSYDDEVVARQNPANLEAEVAALRESLKIAEEEKGRLLQTVNEYQNEVNAATELRAQLKTAEQERDKLRKQTHTLMRDEIDATGDAIENGFDIEPRDYFEKEAPRNGFRFGLAQAIHHIWKRDPKVSTLLAAQERLVAALSERVVAEHDNATYWPKGSERDGHKGEYSTCPQEDCTLLRQLSTLRGQP